MWRSRAAESSSVSFAGFCCSCVFACWEVVLMELRHGVWTSVGKADDCDEIVRLACRIQNGGGDPLALAKRIERLAAQLARELR